MKPNIIDANDMTDSREVYESRPNPWLSYFIYLVLAILLSSFVRAYFSKIDIVVKANGLIHIEDQNTIISTEVPGKINLLNVSEGMFVKKGDLLAEIDSEEIVKAIEEIDKSLKDIDERIEILKVYNDFLNGNIDALETKKDNKYYNEFLGRKKLVNLNNKNIGQSINEKKSSYEAELSSISNQLIDLDNQIISIDDAIYSINSLENLLSFSDEYYDSLVSSFLSNYEMIASKYDKQLQSLIDEMNSLVYSVTNNDDAELQEDITSKQNTLDDSIDNLINERDAELLNLKMQQIALLEQEKNKAQTSKTNLNHNKNMIEAQLDILNSSDLNNDKEINIETEKQNIAKELISYKEKKVELENKQKQNNSNTSKTKIIANNDGYVSFDIDLKEGLYLNKGQAIFKILPENFEKYEVDIYVENSDIGKVKENQPIKLEIPAYPSSEYGFIDSRVINISKETKVDEKTGQSFYIVKSIIEKNKIDSSINLNNEMVTQAKIVVDEKRVLTYILEKINLWD